MQQRDTKDEIKRCLAAMLLVAAAALPACGQPAGDAGSGSLALAASTSPSLSAVVREIDDPHTGARWLLMRDQSHPGGPGRMVQVGVVEGGPSMSREERQFPGAGLNSIAPELVSAPLRPVVRAGDRLIVEEHTRVVDARLEAVALGPAAVGATFNVRLKIGGKVVRAMALGPGRAALQAETEAHP